MSYRIRRLTFLTVVMALGAIHCDSNPREAAPNNEAHVETGEGVTNRIDVPDTVRRNLGITFARVESRPVAQTIRAPGRFELLPRARREYRTMLSGRVELLVSQYDQVEAGEPLYRLSSPEWRELQMKLSEAETVIRQSEAKVAAISPLLNAHRNHESVLSAWVELWEQRVAQLGEPHASGVVSIDEITAARSTLAEKRAELAEVLEKEAELEAQSAAAQADHDAAHARFRLLLATASTLIGVSEQDLAAPYDLDQHLHSGIHTHEELTTRPATGWSQINDIEVRAAASGIVEALDLTNGSWASTGALVMATVEPRRLRFRAMGMQSDLGRLKDGLPARIVPPKGGTIPLQETMSAALSLGLNADPGERTLELIAVPERVADWAKAGVSAHLEIVTAGGQEELAIPLSSVIQDGLAKVFFRRDPRNPDKVIRVEADLGVNDGRWVVVQSGVREGDEVVLDGVYQLMIATSGTVQAGGHFHADGTFHAGEDEKK